LNKDLKQFVGSVARVLPRAVFDSPLMPSAMGVLVILLGAIVCESFMVVHGLGTDLHSPYLLAAVASFVVLWTLFLLRCLRSEWRAPLRRMYWIAAFVCASAMCITLCILAVDFKTTYIPRNPSDFVWNFDMVGAVVNDNYQKKLSLIVFSLLTIVISLAEIVYDVFSEIRSMLYESNS